MKDTSTKTDTVTFDPNSLASADSNIFGLPYTPEQAQMVILPVPWEVTVSYRAGTASGPEAIFEASKQVDLFDPDLKDAWKMGLSMAEIPAEIASLNESMRPKAEEYIGLLEDGENPEDNATMRNLLTEINAACEKMNSWVEESATKLINQNKLVALIGGDHSTPFGLMKALGQKHSEFGILHFDAHADLRDAYEGFKYSHASIMFNALSIKSMKRLVQVGIRDYCEDEHDLIIDSNNRIVTHYDRDIKAKVYAGETWREFAKSVVGQLPQKVYVSFDVDGLDPKYCPNTGTPVPGGLEMEEALYMVKLVVESGKTIIGFDINEVAPSGKEMDEWDANVGARLVWRIANLMAKSNGLKPLA